MDKQIDVSWWNRDWLLRGALLVVTASAVIFLLSSLLEDTAENIRYRAGEVATSTVIASRDFSIEDRPGSESLRVDAENAVARVYVLDDREEATPSHKVDRLFMSLEEESVAAPDGVPSVGEGLSERFGVDLSPDERGILAQQDRWGDIRSTIDRLTSPIVKQGIVATKRPLVAANEKYGVTLVRKSTGEEQLLGSSVNIYSLDEARELLETSLPGAGFGKERAFDTLIYRLARSFLRTNVTFDSALTEQRIHQARESIQPLFFKVERGDVVVRAGETVSALQERKLERLHTLRSGPQGVRLFAGYFALSFIIVGVLYSFLSEFWKEFRPSTRDLALQAALIVGTVLALKLWSIAGQALSLRYVDIGAHAFMLATPFALGGILLQATVGASAVFFFILVLSMLCGVFLEDSWLLLLLVVIGNAAGALSVKYAPRRSVFLIAAIRVGVVNALLAFCYAVLFLPFDNQTGLIQIVSAFCGGLISGLLAASLTPVVEHLGGYISDMKLLELASLDRPLLRDLSVQAPGTWNHSMVMGQLSESAAEAIGANALLVRVGAYYHDIGKMKKPAYFVENQATRENRHDKLSPTMSALIIRAHVKDGLELAAEYGLPQAIVDFIPQHHGTNIIEYFYEKAQREAGEDTEIDDSLFRYAGPKPQTKESGILMIADAVEACSRVLPDPTPARIQGMVQKIVNKIFSSGQLSETDLTLRDLHLIANRFTRVMSGIFHKRIEYSEPVEKQNRTSEEEQGKRDASRDDRPEQGGEGSNVAAEKEDRAHAGDALKRLGIDPQRGESPPH